MVNIQSTQVTHVGVSSDIMPGIGLQSALGGFSMALHPRVDTAIQLQRCLTGEEDLVDSLFAGLLKLIGAPANSVVQHANGKDGAPDTNSLIGSVDLGPHGKWDTYADLAILLAAIGGGGLEARVDETVWERGPLVYNLHSWPGKPCAAKATELRGTGLPATVGLTEYLGLPLFAILSGGDTYVVGLASIDELTMAINSAALEPMKARHNLRALDLPEIQKEYKSSGVNIDLAKARLQARLKATSGGDFDLLASLLERGVLNVGELEISARAAPIGTAGKGKIYSLDNLEFGGRFISGGDSYVTKVLPIYGTLAAFWAREIKLDATIEQAPTIPRDAGPGMFA